MIIPAWKYLRQECQRTRTFRKSADEVLHYFNLLEPPIDPFSIVNNLGIVVKFHKDVDMDGNYTLEGDVPTIHLCSEHRKTRQAFTCASGLGHILLGHPPGKYKEHPKLGINVHLIAANRFAAALLVPRSWMQAYRYVGVKDNDLAAVFDVSDGMIKFRLETTRQE